MKETVMRITLVKEEHVNKLFEALRDSYPASDGYEVIKSKFFDTYNINVVKRK